MANEITLQGTLKVVNSGVTSILSLSSSTFDQTGTARVCGVQALVSAAEESLTFADVAGARWVAFLNHGAANHVDIGLATGVYLWQLPAGAGMWMPMFPGATTFWFLADTVNASLEYLIIDL